MTEDVGEAAGESGQGGGKGGNPGNQLASGGLPLDRNVQPIKGTIDHEATNDPTQQIRKSVKRFVRWSLVVNTFIALATVAQAITSCSALKRIDKQYELMFEANKITKQSADTAKTAADAATKSNEISEKTAERQLRAYVNIGTAGIDKTERPEVYIVTLQIKNYGQTPAYEVVPHIDLKYLKPPFVAGPQTGTGGPFERHGRTILAAGAEADQKRFTTIGKVEMAELKGRARQLLIYGWVTYRTEFGKGYARYFQYRWGGDVASGNTLAFDSQGNYEIEIPPSGPEDAIIAPAPINKQPNAEPDGAR